MGYVIAAILVAFGLGVIRRGDESGSFAPSGTFGFGVNGIGGARAWAPRALPAGAGGLTAAPGARGGPSALLDRSGAALWPLLGSNADAASTAGRD